MDYRNRVSLILFLLGTFLAACQPAAKHLPVTQPWELSPVPEKPTMPASQANEVLNPTPVPELILVEPTALPSNPPPFAPDALAASNLYALPAPDEPHVVGLYGFPPDINPLTGEKVANPSILERRPVLTKISNFPVDTGRPQAGLSYADVVFEYYIGQYMNRFLALYYGQDTPKSWPLRSGRTVDPQLTTMFQGILVYGNADETRTEIIQSILGELSLAFKESPCPPICGVETHDATGVYVVTNEVTKFYNEKGIENQKPYLNGWIFDSQPPFSNEPAETVGVQFIRWNRGEWRYDAASGKYLRWIESWENEEYPLIPMIDQVNGKQLAFSNVIILFTEVKELAPTSHDIKIWDNTYGEKAYFFRDGVLIKGGWYTPDPNKPMVFLNQDGTPYRLKPGNTWIVLAGLASDFEQTDPAKYYLYFDIP